MVFPKLYVTTGIFDLILTSVDGIRLIISGLFIIGAIRISTEINIIITIVYTGVSFHLKR